MGEEGIAFLSNNMKHEVTKSISTAPGWDGSSPLGIPLALNSPVPIYTPGWKEAL